MATNHIENRGGINIRKEGTPRGERFERADVNNLSQMQDIFDIVTDTENMKHLAGISTSTGISDIIAHYKKDPKERDGRVMIDDSKVVGIGEVCPMDFSRLALKREEDTSWQIRSAILNRLCVRKDEQKKGRGTKMVAHLEDVAFTEHDYSTLIAAIILDEPQKKAYNKAFREGTVTEFVEAFKNNDARGKIFLRNRKWKFSGVLMDQGGFKETELAHVLLVQKTRIDWDREQRSRRPAVRAS